MDFLFQIFSETRKNFEKKILNDSFSYRSKVIRNFSGMSRELIKATQIPARDEGHILFWICICFLVAYLLSRSLPYRSLTASTIVGQFVESEQKY